MQRFISDGEAEILMAEACQEKAYPATVHFYLDVSTGPPRPHGCGVLFTFEGNYFVLTASHLLDKTNFTALRIMIDGTVYKLDGSTFKFAIPEEGDKNNYVGNIDLAILKLGDGELLNRLKAERNFTELQDILFDQNQKVGILPSHEAALNAYYIIGYPASRTKFNEKTSSYHSTLFGIYCTLHKKNLNRLEKEFGEYHLFFDYRKSGKSLKHQKKVKLPKYYGLSGTGIWKTDHFNINGTFNVKLAGIFLQVSQKETIMVGLRIDLIIQELRTQFNLPRLPKRSLSS